MKDTPLPTLEDARALLVRITKVFGIPPVTFPKEGEQFTMVLGKEHNPVFNIRACIASSGKAEREFSISALKDACEQIAYDSHLESGKIVIYSGRDGFEKQDQRDVDFRVVGNAMPTITQTLDAIGERARIRRLERDKDTGHGARGRG
jgi:hypothetical protein